MKIKLSVVISVFNEEDSVEMLVSRIHENLLDFEYEIILVDDGSNDRTIPKIKSMRDEKVHLIELQKNYGQSSALAAGIDYATGDYIVTMDGDLQNDPADIPRMVEMALNEDWDLVAGIRKNRKDNWLRTFPSKIANSIIRRSTGVRIADNGCALKVFKAQLAKNIGLYGELHRFISVLAAFEGARFTQMEVNHYPRPYGQSKYGFRRTFKVISDLLLMIFFRKYMQKPMHLFGSLGILAFVAGAVINLYLLVLKIGGQDLWGKPLLLLGVMLLIGGIQLVTIGIMAEFLMRTYYESQQKKPYRVRNVTTFSEEK